MSFMYPQRRRRVVWDDTQGDLSPYSKEGQAFSPYSSQNIRNPYLRAQTLMPREQRDSDANAKSNDHELPADKS